MKKLIFIPFFIFIVSTKGLNAQNPFETLKQMISKTQQIKGLKYELIIFERFNGEYEKQYGFFKLNTSPLKVYTRAYKPNEGQEVLFVSGWNDNKLYVNPNRFGMMNLSLDPFGSMAHDKQHHTIFDSGYGFFINLLSYMIAKYPNLEKSVSALPNTTFDKHECFVFLIQIPDFKYETYTVLKNETVFSIAAKKRVNEYMILEKNNLSDYSDLKVF